MKNDIKSDPCENCIFEEGSRYCVEHCPYDAEVEPKSCNCKDVLDCEYCDEDGFCQYSKLCISQRSVCNKFIDKQEPCENIAEERYKDLCEYFGEMKDILKSRKDFKAWLERVKWHIHKAEELYEKYEYKQESCDVNNIIATQFKDTDSNWTECHNYV